MNDLEFNDQIDIIRKATDLILETGDFSHNVKIESAWQLILAAGRGLEATTIFQNEALTDLQEEVSY